MFTTKGVTVHRNRFDYLISSFSPEFATEVRDLPLKPPTYDPYDILKVELVKRTTASEPRKVSNSSVVGEELGNCKPTQLLCRMQQLLGDKLGTSADSNSFLREFFLQRLPPNGRMVLASTYTTMDLNKLADKADKFIEVSTTTVASISVPESQQQTYISEIKQLREDITCLTELVISLKVHPRQRSRSTSHCTSSPAPQHQKSTTTNSFCWYHTKFGEAAQKCKEPCNWENSQARH